MASICGCRSDWDLIVLPAVTNQHALKNRFGAKQMAAVIAIIVAQRGRHDQRQQVAKLLPMGPS